MSILHKILGPNKNAVWKQFCIKIGGDYETGGRWFSESIIRARYRNWTIVLDTYLLPGSRVPTVCTRMHVAYVSKDAFSFSLYRSDIVPKLMNVFAISRTMAGPPQIDSVGPLFGAASYIDTRPIESSLCGFDEKVIISTNDEARVRILFKDLKIRELIQSQKSLSLEARKVDGPGAQSSQLVFELRFYVDNIVRDLDVLESMYAIIVHILDILHNIGLAEERPPN